MVITWLLMMTPQPGQVGALLETSRSHSGHLISDMMFLPLNYLKRRGLISDIHARVLDLLFRIIASIDKAIQLYFLEPMRLLTQVKRGKYRLVQDCMNNIHYSFGGIGYVVNLCLSLVCYSICKSPVLQ